LYKENIMKVLEKNTTKQVKITDNSDNAGSSVIFVFSTETTSQEFEDYIDSLMQREFAYGEPMY